MNAASPIPATQHATQPLFTILIDGLCPLCAKEAAFMRRLDAGRGRLAIIDIAHPDFNPAAFGITQEAVMGEIHGLIPTGPASTTLIKGVEVFRRAYAALGYGWLLAPTAWPGFRWLSDKAYQWFAKNRLWLTRRKDCTTGACKVK